MNEATYSVEETDSCGHDNCREHIEFFLIDDKIGIPVARYETGSHDQEETRQRFARMALDHNSLAGIDTSALESGVIAELIAAAKEAMDRHREIRAGDDWGVWLPMKEGSRLRDALANAEKGTVTQ